MSAVAKNFVFEAVSGNGCAGFGEFDAVDGAEAAVFLDFVGILGFESFGFFIELGFEVFSLSENEFLFYGLKSGDGGGAD